MKVSLVAEVLSMSVALSECRSLGVEDSLDHRRQRYFLRLFSDLFSVLNYRSMHQKHWKKPLCPQNIGQVKQFFRCADANLSSLRDSHGGPTLLHTNCKTGFIGFRICMKSLLGLYNFLVVEKQMYTCQHIK